MWEFLTYLEVSSINSKIDSSNEQIDSGKTYNMVISGFIEELFEELFLSNNDLSKMNLKKTFKIEEFIKSEFDRKSKYTFKPTYSFSSIFFTVVFAIIDCFAVYADSLFLLVVSSFILLGFVTSVYDDYKKISNFNKKMENIKKELPALKKQFSSLTAYGIYFKWFLDKECATSIKMFTKVAPKEQIYKTLEIFYTIFELDASSRQDYNKYIVSEFNKDTILAYNSL